jgi:hypothetical protein
MPRLGSTRRSAVILGALLAAALAPAPARATVADEHPTLRGLDAAWSPLLAGDRVLATHGDRLVRWSVRGGPPLGREDFDEPLTLLAAGPEMAMLGFEHLVIADERGGPRVEPGACEAESRVAAVHGRRIAYVPAPEPGPYCGPGAPGAAVVVRDQAAPAGQELLATVPLADRADVTALALGEHHVAFGERTSPTTSMPVRVDLRSGARTRAFSRSADWRFAMDADGTLVAGRFTPTRTPEQCPGRMAGIRVLAPDLTVTKVADAACGDVLALAGGRLTFAHPYGDGFAEVVTGPVGGPYAPVARIAGTLVAADATRALVTDETCWGDDDVRSVPLSARPGVDEPGPARCPVRLTAAARGRAVRVTVRCPRGCNALVRLEGRRGTGRVVRLRPGGRRTLRLRPPGRGRKVTLKVQARHRTGLDSEWRRTMILEGS